MDTSSNVVTEAHAVGLPVLGTFAGGMPDMVKDEQDGFIVPVDDVALMSQRMGILLSDLNRCADMARWGREKVLLLNDAKRIAADHVEFYYEVLGW